MTARLKFRSKSIPWFGITLLGIGLLAAGLRLWGLGRFNELVFDEVYFAKFATHYLTGTEFFDAHPPLGKYLIAAGIWLAEQTHWLDDAPQNDLTDLVLSPISYRWLNAVVGSFIPLTVAWLAYQLSHLSPYRYTYAWVAGLFTTLDGLLLVESRYALINIYLVLFGLLSHGCALQAVNQPAGKRSPWLLLSGLSLGAAIAVKWNGLGFWLGLLLPWTLAQGWQLFQPASARSKLAAVQKLSCLSLRDVMLYWGILPLMVYGLSWIPHLQMNDIGFGQVHTNILNYHQRVGNGSEVHPYCSAWYTWPLMLRPVAYFYEAITDPGKLPDTLGSAILTAKGKVVYDVHAMGNPLLWWLATAAIALLVMQLLFRITWAARQPLRQSNQTQSFSRNSSETRILWIGAYLGLNYAANWLPWMLVSRCIFLYHYMAASVFAILAIAFLTSRWLHSPQQWRRIAGCSVIGIVTVAFMFWLPIYLGLPLASPDLRLRWWLPSWI